MSRLVTGTERQLLATHLAGRYAAGESIRDLASSAGRSYGFVHRVLTESGVQLRPRGDTRPAKRIHVDQSTEVGRVITAKVKCSSKAETGEGDQRQAVVEFQADYADGRNKEWSLYTPHLSLSMTLRGAVADQFEKGRAFTLQFVEESAPEPVAES